MQTQLTVKTNGPGLYEFTQIVQQALNGSKSDTPGICNLFCQHTSAGLTINENADPTARQDLERWLEDIVTPEMAAKFKHTYEGDDDMPAHIKTLLSSSDLNIPLDDQGTLLLGTWQGIYLCEFRRGQHNRSIILTSV